LKAGIFVPKSGKVFLFPDEYHENTDCLEERYYIENNPVQRYSIGFTWRGGPSYQLKYPGYAHYNK